MPCLKHYAVLFTLLVLSLGLSETVHAQYADQLGRLFSTPRERAELDEIRRIWLQDVTPGETLELPSEDELSVTPPPPNDLFLMLGGTVRRADGSYTLWINNEPVDQRQLPSNIKLARIGDLIVVWINYKDKLFVVRPGQVLHFASGTVYELYSLPSDLAALISPPPQETAPASTTASANSPTVVAPEPGTNPASLLGNGSPVAGLLENISKISATLNMIQELTQ